MGLSENIAAAKETNETIQLLIESYGKEKVAELLSRALVELNYKPDGKNVGPMSYEEARKFSDTTVVFGKWKGTKVIDVPGDYWEWLLDNNKFAVDLKRYTESSYYQNLGEDVDLEIEEDYIPSPGEEPF